MELETSIQINPFYNEAGTVFSDSLRFNFVPLQNAPVIFFVKPQEG